MSNDEKEALKVEVKEDVVKDVIDLLKTKSIKLLLYRGFILLALGYIGGLGLDIKKTVKEITELPKRVEYQGEAISQHAKVLDDHSKKLSDLHDFQVRTQQANKL